MQLYVAISSQTELIIYEMFSGSVVHRISSEFNALAIALYPNSDFYFLLVPYRGVVVMTNKGVTKDILNPKTGCSSLALSPDGRLMAAGTYTGMVEIWQLPSMTNNKRSRTHLFKAHIGATSALSFSADSSHIFSGGGDGLLYCHNVNNGKLVQCCEGHVGEITDIAITNGPIVVTSGGYRDGSVKVWRLDYGIEILTTTAKLNDRELGMSSVAVCPATFQLFTGNVAGTLNQISLEDGRILWETEAHETSITKLWVSPKGTWLLSVGTEDIKLWNTSTRELVSSVICDYYISCSAVFAEGTDFPKLNIPKSTASLVKPIFSDKWDKQK